MSVESPEDRLTFLDPEAFGVEAVYAARTGEAPRTVAGIFDAEAVSSDPRQWMGGPDYSMQTGAKFASTGPTFNCRSADLVKGGKRNDRLTIEGVNYTVQEVKPDGTGMVVLVLIEEGDE